MSLGMYLSDEATKVLAQLRKMVGTSGKLRTSSCIPKLAGALKLSRIAVDEAIRDLYRARLLLYQADNRELPISGVISVVLELTAHNPQEVIWREALAESGLPKEIVEELSSLSSYLGGITPEDLAALARVLRKLSEADTTKLDDAGFNVSARHLQGSSKVLSMMSNRMMNMLGLPLHLRTPSPRYVICAGPANPVATLLIENPRAFENAVRCRLSDEVALICTYGFGLSHLGEDWQQASTTHEHPILVVREGVPPSLNELLNAQKVFFWGDLDLAAISIFRTLRRTVPHLQMSLIYEAMLPMVQDLELSHPYADIFDKSGQVKDLSIKYSTPQDLDLVSLAIWQACQTRAVDQEAISDLIIRSHGAFPLTLSTD